jgi:nucleoside-diphosphate-sugar epimerase
MACIGDGGQYISIVHPVDVASCLCGALERGRDGEAYNVVSFVCTVQSLLSTVACELGVPAPMRRVPYGLAYVFAALSELFSVREPAVTRFRVKSMGTSRRISAEKARKDLGFEPRYDLHRTVADMVSWYRSGQP